MHSAQLHCWSVVDNAKLALCCILNANTYHVFQNPFHGIGVRDRIVEKLDDILLQGIEVSNLNC